MVIETQLPGHAATRRLSEDATSAAAATAMTALHRATTVTQIVDDAALARWVDEPLDFLRGLRGLPGDLQSLERLRVLLHDALAGREVATSWVHGDFWPGNVLVEETASGVDPAHGLESVGAATDGVDAEVRVTGLADWENAEPGGLPDVDLLIRSSGEMRTSNFMIWQAAYAEFVSVDTLWPDFDRRDLWNACLEFARRDRRFGGAEEITKS